MELLTCNTVCSSHTVFDQVLFNILWNENPGHWCQGNVLEWNMNDFWATFRTLSPSLCPLMKRNSAHFVFFFAIYESFSWHCSLPCAIRILASYALVPLTTTSLSFVSLLSGHFLEKRRTRYELRIRICYQKWSSFNLPLHLLLTAWAVVCRWHPALPVTPGINPEIVRFNTNSSSEIAQNFNHFKYSLLVNKKNILCEYSSFFKPSTWNYVRLNWINLPRTTLYPNDRYNKTPLCGRAVFAATDFPLHNKA